MTTDVLEYQAHDDPPARDLAVVDAGLHAANQAAAPLAEVRALACFAYAPGGTPIAGAVGRTWGECCELQQLWVTPELRRRGVAASLLKQFEVKAIGRGCRFFYLETFSFQAPDFYRRQGYRSVLQLDGFSAGISKHLMVKRVGRGSARA